MPAKALQQVGALRERIQEVQAGHGSPASVGDTIGKREENGGAVIALHQLGSHDADDARVPARRTGHDGNVVYGHR